ncbi:MAG: hypothetical protein NC930_01450 [Candidatus Omnitrophica bacterium]|nr:hypothetical protein [Candidatus Omnitrophota bacterium]
MKQKSPSGYKIYDPERGRVLPLERLIERLGILAVAHKFNVDESTVYKWRRGVHRPSRKTLTKAQKQLFPV